MKYASKSKLIDAFRIPDRPTEALNKFIDESKGKIVYYFTYGSGSGSLSTEVLRVEYGLHYESPNDNPIAYSGDWVVIDENYKFIDEDEFYNLYTHVGTKYTMVPEIVEAMQVPETPTDEFRNFIFAKHCPGLIYSISDRWAKVEGKMEILTLTKVELDLKKAFVGYWVVRDSSGGMSIYKDTKFQELYSPEQ